MSDETKESVDHPAHYGGGENPYECIRVVEAWGLGFHLGNAVKYTARAGKKGPMLEDIKTCLSGWHPKESVGQCRRGCAGRRGASAHGGAGMTRGGASGRGGSGSTTASRGPAAGAYAPRRAAGGAPRADRCAPAQSFAAHPRDVTAAAWQTKQSVRTRAHSQQRGMRRIWQ